MNRRDFLALTSLAPLCVFAPRLRAAEPGPAWNRVLVLVELQGGNDGLNTIVPSRDAQYHALRPQLGVARDNVLPLSDDLGLNPVLEPLMPLWKSNELALVLGVGYPNPNRSHFRSIEIWETASSS